MSTRELPTENLYDVLGVPENATGDLIDARFRSLAKLFHPDRNPGDDEAEERFKRMSAAYRVLSDPQRRAEYDAYRQMMTADELPRPSVSAVRPTVRAGKRRTRKPVPKRVRVAIAAVLVLSGLAVMTWRLVARDNMDAATDVTFWIVGLKLLVVGLIAWFLPQIRALWDRAARST